MYLILDEVMRKSLVVQEKVDENFNTSLLSNDDHDIDNIFDTYDIIVNPTAHFVIAKIQFTCIQDQVKLILTIYSNNLYQFTEYQ